ncbi:phosphotransferase [Arhodomonas sp. AD133]|uniref:phosphotransferase n=1 Tax=Arhodomonas sp. AD133 TaxID=3415009 RepID=UPI003EBB8378
MTTDMARATREATEVLAGAVSRWLPLDHGGTSNRLLLGEDRAGTPRWVLRVNAPPERAFGVNRLREAAVLDGIAEAPWAPRVIDNRPMTGWCLFAWHGEPAELSRTLMNALMDAVASWQRLSDPPAFDYNALFSAYAARLDDAMQPLLARLHDELAALPAVPRCLCHHDLHAGNLCVGDDGALTVLDWEYAGGGIPWFDAIALHDEFGVNASAIRGLPAFEALDAGRVDEGLGRARWCARALECLWWGVREAGADRRLQVRARRLLAGVPGEQRVGRRQR